MIVSRREKLFLFFIFLFFITVSCFLYVSISRSDFKLLKINFPAPQSQDNIFEEVTITRVVDGDTVVDDQNRKIRLIGINTPEITKPNDLLCFGKLASQKTTDILLDKKVKLEKDISQTDKYGRLLRYIWIDNAMINQTLIEMGYAQVDTVPPDIKYHQLFINSQKKAKELSVGLWGGGCHD